MKYEECLTSNNKTSCVYYLKTVHFFTIKDMILFIERESACVGHCLITGIYMEIRRKQMLVCVGVVWSSGHADRKQF